MFLSNYGDVSFKLEMLLSSYADVPSNWRCFPSHYRSPLRTIDRPIKNSWPPPTIKFLLVISLSSSWSFHSLPPIFLHFHFFHFSSSVFFPPSPHPAAFHRSQQIFYFTFFSFISLSFHFSKCPLPPPHFQSPRKIIKKSPHPPTHPPFEWTDI